MRPTIKDYWKQFLHGYISHGHTVWDETEEEVKRLTDEFVEDRTDEYCFHDTVIYNYVNYIERNLSDDYKRLYTLRYDPSRYVYLLERYIRHIFNS